MRLNHLNLCVADLAEARDFFARHLDFATLDQKGEALVVMTDGQGFTLVLADSQRFGGAAPAYPEGFHLGFILDTPAAVDQAHARLVAADLATGRGPRALHGSYGFYFTALGGILFEIACPLT